MIMDWMDRFVEFSSTWLWLVMIATWRALPILVLVIGIGLALRRRLTPTLSALLWTIVIARLLIPISIGSPLSLHKPIDDWFSSDSDESGNLNRPMFAHEQRYWLLPNVDHIVERDIPAQAHLQSPQIPDTTFEEILGVILGLFLFSVSMGLLLRSILSHVRFAIGLQSCRLLEDQPLIDLLLRECDSLAVGRRPLLREVESLAAPAVFGLFRQTICFPSGLIETLSEQELRWVIRHELAHLRRRDIPVVTIASIAIAFHWFNPAVWLIVKRLRAAMESAADRLALQSLAQSEVAGYGKLLLRLAEDSSAARKSPTLGLISFASGKHLKRRVELLMRDTKPNGLSARFLSSVLVLALAWGGLTDARDAKDQKMPEVHLLASDSVDLQVQPMWNGPLFEQEPGGRTFVESYDVASIFETMPQTLKSIEKTPLQQLTHWIRVPPTLTEKLHLDGQVLSAELTASQHQLLKHTLDVWKDGEPQQITIEARFIQTNTKTASTIEWAERRLDGFTVRGLGPAIAAHIDEPALARLVRLVSADRRGNILLAPKVTLFDGQTAGIADQVQHPFVTGVDDRMQAIVSLVDDGLSFEVTPRADADDAITLAFKVKASSIGKVSYANLPIRTPYHAVPPFTVQVPATELFEISSTVKLAAGESVVVAIPRVFSNEPGADSETTMIVALTPRIIATQELSGVSDGAP